MQLDIAQWCGLFLVEQVHLPVVHEVGELAPHTGGDGAAGHGIAFMDCDGEVDHWNLNTGSQVLVGLHNSFVDLALEFALELAGGEAECGLERGLFNVSEGSSHDLTEKITLLGVQSGTTGHIKEGSLDGLLTVNVDEDLQVAGGSALALSEFGSAWALDELSSESNSLARSVFGEDLWDEDTEVVGSDRNIQVFFKQVSQIKSVSSGEAGLESSGDGVVS